MNVTRGDVSLCRRINGRVYENKKFAFIENRVNTTDVYAWNFEKGIQEIKWYTVQNILGH